MAVPSSEEGKVVTLSFHHKVKQNEHKIIKKKELKIHTHTRSNQTRKGNQPYTVHVKNGNRRIWWTEQCDRFSAPATTPWGNSEQRRGVNKILSIVLQVPGQRESGQGGKPMVFKMGNKALKSGTPHTTLRDTGKDKKCWDLSS